MAAEILENLLSRGADQVHDLCLFILFSFSTGFWFFYFHFLPPFSLDPAYLVGSRIDQFLKISTPFHVFVIYSTEGPTPNEST